MLRGNFIVINIYFLKKRSKITNSNFLPLETKNKTRREAGGKLNPKQAEGRK